MIVPNFIPNDYFCQLGILKANTVKIFRCLPKLVFFGSKPECPTFPGRICINIKKHGKNYRHR